MKLLPAGVLDRDPERFGVALRRGTEGLRNTPDLRREGVLDDASALGCWNFLADHVSYFFLRLGRLDLATTLGAVEPAAAAVAEVIHPLDSSAMVPQGPLTTVSRRRYWGDSDSRSGIFVLFSREREILLKKSRAVPGDPAGAKKQTLSHATALKRLVVY